MPALTFLLSFAAALVVERLALSWLDARDRRDRRARVLLSTAHEALSWVPVLVAIELDAPVAAVAAVAGVALANWWSR